MRREIDYTLCLVTDRGLMSAPTIEAAAESAIKGGCTLVQLREKTASSLEFYETAVRVKAITDRYGVPLIINDRLDVALAVGADGAHVGQSDVPARAARRLLPGRILGVSASNPADARRAEAGGADYLGVGAMFATGTKSDAKLTSMDDLRAIIASVSIPVLAIGGINANNARIFREAGASGLAVVSAIISAPDIESAAREVKTAFLGS
jgi:thiamine-phosphate pyrophosphorylase